MLFHRRYSWLVPAAVLLVVLALLAGCAGQPPTPTPAPMPSRSEAESAAAGRGDVSSPTPAALPPTPATLPPTPAVTITPTPTRRGDVPSPTPSPTATITPTRTGQIASPSAQTPARPSDLLLAQALRLQHNGDYEAAIDLYRTLLDAQAAPDLAREARYRLAESSLLARDYVGAAAAWQAFIAAYPQDRRLPYASLMLARAYRAAGDCAAALPHYQAYLSQQTVLADMAYESIGDCYAADADPAAWDKALAAYRQALAAATDRGLQVSLRERIAGILLARSDYAAAVAEYDAILAVARIEDYRAKIEYLAGQALALAGQADAAHTRYLRAANSYPQAEHAYLSMIELVEAGVEVDELQRGRVDYYAGADHPDAYGAAIRAFDRYLAATPAPKVDEALYLKALSQRAAEGPEAALKTFQALIDGYPQSQYLARAWLEKGATYAAQDADDQAVKVYQDLAAFFPASDLAPQALLRAARLREGQAAFVEAARLYEDLQARFPAFEDADEALWRAGLAYDQAGDPSSAIATWRALVAKYPKSAYRTKTLYWLGKLGAEAGSETGYWDQLLRADPNGYYALRVQQNRSSGPLTGSQLVTATVEPPAWDAAQAQAEIGAWLAGWAEPPAGAQPDRLLATLPVTLTRRADWQRGQALLAVGLRTEALAAFDTVRAAAWNDPWSLAPLAFSWHDQGLYGLAARAAARLAGLWPGGTIDKAPPALQRLSYPLAYADLLSTEAQLRSLDPLLLAALIRQESLFEPAAESYAGARGLGQVMPATGEGIARSLGVDGFVLDDLYRPSISVRFAAYYLAVQMHRFDDQVLVALAAYNGGPGNTLNWLDATLRTADDLDLFVELITASQSRIYLQRVLEQYTAYQKLYRN